MSSNDADMKMISALTDEWIECVATKNVERVAEILADDFIYSRHPKLGEATMSKAEMLAFMSSIEKSDTKVIDQRLHQIGDVILVHNVTQANQTVDAQQAAGSFVGVRLLDSSAWRKESDGAWRCSDYRLIDVLN